VIVAFQGPALGIVLDHDASPRLLAFPLLAGERRIEEHEAIRQTAVEPNTMGAPATCFGFSANVALEVGALLPDVHARRICAVDLLAEVHRELPFNGASRKNVARFAMGPDLGAIL
jgi:hypothetical protein